MTSRRSRPFQKLFFFVSILLSLLFVWHDSAPAYWVWSPESGKFINPESAAEDTADEQYEYAMGFYEARDFEKAAEELGNLTKKYPGARIASEAQFRLAAIYEEQGEFERAFRAFQKIVDSYPNSSRMNEVIERQFRIGNVFLSGKRPTLMGLPIRQALPKAIEIFEQVIKNAPYSEYGDKALFNLGVAYKRSGNFQKSLETFQRLIDNYPTSGLVPDAKFQLGEVSYEMSKNMNRSQEGLETAEDYFTSFLEDYPETNVKEKAAKLKRAIDEKNAEKNYKIGEYYERENYLDSAVIYFEDVVKNYSDTSWAARAEEKLAIFRSPVKFIKEKESSIEAEVTRLHLRRNEIEAALKKLPKGEKLKRKTYEETLDKLGKSEREIRASKRAFSKRKSSDIQRRVLALKRKTAELKEKRKALARKIKSMRHIKSEDLQKAFRSWSESLDSEALALQKEKTDLARIKEELGMGSKIRMPFGQPENIERVRDMHIDDLSSLMHEKKVWDIKKEELYEFRNTVLSRLDLLQGEDIEILASKKEFRDLLEKNGGDLNGRLSLVDTRKSELAAMEKEIEEKRAEYDAAVASGKISRILKVPGKIVSESWDLVTFSSDDPRQKIAALRERSLEINREISARQELIAAVQAKKKLGEAPIFEQPVYDERVPADVQLKKRLKLVEREIRWRFDEVEDRNATKKAKVDELDAILTGVRERKFGPAKAAIAPARGTYKVMHAFLFGLKQKEEVIRTEAIQAESRVSEKELMKEIQRLREEIEFETLLIEARAREIKSLEKDRAKLQKKAARTLKDGQALKSGYVARPGMVLDDVLANTSKILPGKDRDMIYSEKVKGASKELYDLKMEKKEIEKTISELESQVSKAAPAPAPKPSRVSTGRRARRERAEKLRADIDTLETRYNERRAEYSEERTRLQVDLKKFYQNNISKRIEERFSEGEKEVKQQKKIYVKERKKTEEEILKILKKQEKLVLRQQELLKERKDRIANRIEDYRKKDDYRYEVLEDDLERLVEQVRQARLERQNLLEEKRKLSESLKTEVSALER